MEPKESAWYSRWSSGQIGVAENAELDVNVFDARKFVSGAMFDCEKLTWHQVVSAPFVWEDGEVRGVVAVAVSLHDFDLERCGGRVAAAGAGSNPFAATDNCDRESTVCENVQGRGFRVDSFTCQCRTGFYRANSSVECVPCSPGCDTCTGKRFALTLYLTPP